MFRVILGVVFMIVTLALAGADGVLWWRSGLLEFRSLGAVWLKLDSGSLNFAQDLVQRYLWPAVWDPGITTLLLLPAWLLPGIFALVLFVSARRAPRDTAVFGKLVK